MPRIFYLFIVCVLLSSNPAVAQVKVTLDCFYNHERNAQTGTLHHYTWDDHSWKGFSFLGELFRRYGAVTENITEAPTFSSLRDSKVYIIVDPDHEKDNPSPNYMTDATARELERWVRKGGRLVVLTNDHNNCDLVHINKLTDLFGLHFNDVNFDAPKEIGSECLASHPLWASLKGSLFMRGTSTISLSDAAKALVTAPTGEVLMAEARHGKGTVIAVTDPWIYNEYLGHILLSAEYANEVAADNLVRYLLSPDFTLSIPAKGTAFVSISGYDLVKPTGEKLFIQGTNLGNWLNPEGYMFGFSRTNSAGMIDLMLREAVGPDFVNVFWREFKDNYITRRDIEYIASTGANVVRLPFHYKLFTDEDYMGLTRNQDGFERVDSLVEWCRASGLYLILDMHDCPGGQTGDNIDDSYGYPWLLESEESQALFCDIWQRIAEHYCNEPVVLAYELANEPIAHYFPNKEDLNNKLEPLYKKAVEAIRKVDENHIVMLGGARWNSDFYMFHDWQFDSRIMYTCHRYGGDATAEAIKDYTDHRRRSHLPMYMGEIGHNTMKWQSDFAKVMKELNIGYTFWPYKKVDSSCMVGFDRPENWDSTIVKFSEAQRGTYSEIRDARPDQATARKALTDFLSNCRFEKCTPQKDYIISMGLKP